MPQPPGLRCRARHQAKKAEAKSKKAKPVVKAGAKKVADPEGSLKRKQFAKLQKTGRMEDAIDLIMKT